LKLTAKTFHGLEEVLAQELEALGAKDIKVLKRAVSYSGDLELVYKSNLHLRTALRILQPVMDFKAKNEHELYNKVMEFDWSKYFNATNTIAIDSIVNSKVFTHSKYVAYKTKDAIADQFRNKTGKRPTVDTDNPDIRLNVHCLENHFTISFDSSGNSLHMRGYRSNLHKAPINEALAAGMILLSGWQKDIPFLDPMCGSGTIPMEAYMIASNTPPGIKRKEYGFMKWRNYDELLWKKVYNEAMDQIIEPEVEISGADNSAFSAKLANDSAEGFGLEGKIHFERKPFQRQRPETDKGIIVMNPPYGERLEEDDIALLYKVIGDTLKKRYNGWDCWLITSNVDALKYIALKPSKKLHLYNGALDCKFNRYSMYEGSLKENKEDQL